MVTPLHKVFMADDVEDFLSPVLHSGYIGDGPRVVEFEAALGEMIGNPRVLCVNSGTSAITMALRLAGVGHGDRVLSTPMTCLATNMAVLSLGAVPVWVDVLPDGTMDPKDAAMKAAGCRAILCVDLAGVPCKVNDLKAIGLPVVEDACQSLGAEYCGQPVGNAADYACFSFQAIKYLTTGDGGAIAFNTDGLDDGRLMRWFGLDRTRSWSLRCQQDPPFWGYKFHMTDIAASIGLANIRHVGGLLRKARANAAVYDEKFRWCHNMYKTARDPGRISANWLYTILVNDRSGFVSFMADHGVECSPVQMRNDRKTVFKDFQTSLPKLDWFDNHQVNIPVGWWVDNAEEIADLVEEYEKGDVDTWPVKTY